ncbi:hypothetical protein [Dechloromonas sp. ZS-1]|uniref:hypothetical protein n=1 Tax=Dechloromonas sp. ZS-1 TaxID=3138067 RepID=UPI0031FE35F4
MSDYKRLRQDASQAGDQYRIDMVAPDKNDEPEQTLHKRPFSPRMVAMLIRASIFPGPCSLKSFYATSSAAPCTEQPDHAGNICSTMEQVFIS